MPHDPVSRFRRFARAVTMEVGALDTSFLGRGRPLGAARVVNAIGMGRTDVADIRDYLGLDSGLMSSAVWRMKALSEPRRILTMRAAGLPPSPRRASVNFWPTRNFPRQEHPRCWTARRVRMNSFGPWT
jgi:hypothetical protein